MDLTDQELFSEVRRATERGRKLKLPRYTKNLRFDANGIYSHGSQIAELNMLNKTIRSLGKWSLTSSKHYNYARNLLREAYGFQEL